MNDTLQIKKYYQHRLHIRAILNCFFWCFVDFHIPMCTPTPLLRLHTRCKVSLLGVHDVRQVTVVDIVLCHCAALHC